MALKIIGAGYGRTGTMSLYSALNHLGFPCYHMIELMENKDNKTHLDFWLDVANGEEGQQYDFEQVFGNYTAAVDFPASCVWQELLSASPQAKVILTVHPRGPDSWYESTLETIYSTETLWQFKVLRLVAPFARKFGNMTSKLIWQRSLKGAMNDRTKAIAQYRHHIKEVMAKVPSDKLLIYSVDQGWGPLCNFLDIPIPEGEFPNVNDRAEIKKTLRGMVRGAYFILGLGAIVLIGLLYTLIRLF